MPHISPKILIVDDEEDFLDLFGQQLTEQGIPFATADRGLDALKLIDELPDLRVIVSDIRMPGMDGLELLRRVKVKDPSITVIMVTGFDDRAGEAEKLGANSLHLKPFDFRDLIGEIIKYL